MVEYNCILCNYKSKSNFNYQRHLQTNKHKKAENERLESKPANARECPRMPAKAREDNPVEKNQLLSDTCPYCAIKCKKRNRLAHFRNNCQLIPESKRKVFIEKYNNHKLSKKQLVINNNTNNINNTDNRTSINNSNNTTNNNIQNNNIQNNIIVKVNPLGQEDISFLTEQDKLEILAKRFMGVPELIKRIYGNPKNKNFYIPNVNKKVIAYLNEDNKLEYDNYYTILNQIIDDNKDRFDDFYHELIDKINSKLIDRVAVVIQEHATNEKINDKYMDDIKFNLISNSKEIKETIEEYMKYIKEKINLGLEE
jgi:hypothetical protein